MNHLNIIEKRNHLEEVAAQLRREFVGLDDIIHEITDLMSTWYILPQAQVRPLLINLWGLTGSGKTALISRMVELLDHGKLYVKIDMGEFESNSSAWMKDLFTDDLYNFDNQPGIICFDEFQFARTINKEGEELGRDKLRVVWDIIDSGSVSYLSYLSSINFYRTENCLQILEKCRIKGLQVEQGKIVGGLQVLKSEMEDFYYFKAENQDMLNENYFLSEDFVSGVSSLYNGKFKTSEIKVMIERSNLEGLLALMTEGLRQCNASVSIDLSKCIIFIVGNLDEAYYMSNSLNPDISADELYEETKKINITHIKKSLKKRFRNEQIARLGNNHIIYRSFSRQHYQDIIRLRLEQIRVKTMNDQGLDICFTDRVADILYSEGVFPAQGTRPVFTSISQYIESSLGKLCVFRLECELKSSRVIWDYADNAFRLSFPDEGCTPIPELVISPRLKLKGLRSSDNFANQAHTAVHESGHAILAALTLRIIPAVAISKTASADAEGFCLINLPEGPSTYEVICKNIMITLGGYLAEKLIFGKENISGGVESDIQIVTEMATNAVQKYAMGKHPFLISTDRKDDQIPLSRREEKEIKALILQCEKRAMRTLKRNKRLLLKMSEYLSQHSRIEENEIRKFVILYASDSWVKEEAFKGTRDYFRFHELVHQKVNQMDRPAQKLLAKIRQFFL